jgi:hypothetical protein
MTGFKSSPAQLYTNVYADTRLIVFQDSLIEIQMSRHEREDRSYRQTGLVRPASGSFFADPASTVFQGSSGQPVVLSWRGVAHPLAEQCLADVDAIYTPLVVLLPTGPRNLVTRYAFIYESVARAGLLSPDELK